MLAIVKTYPPVVDQFELGLLVLVGYTVLKTYPPVVDQSELGLLVLVGAILTWLADQNHPFTFLQKIVKLFWWSYTVQYCHRIIDDRIEKSIRGRRIGHCTLGWVDFALFFEF